MVKYSVYLFILLDILSKDHFHMKHEERVVKLWIRIILLKL